MVKITYESILARAISDCYESLQGAMENVEEYRRMGNETEAKWFYCEVVELLQEELDGLKQLYQIETGVPFDGEEG